MIFKLPRCTWAIGLGLVCLAAVTVAAQNVPPPVLTLTSPDSGHPAQFQAIAPGEAPSTAGFSRALEVAGPEVDPDRSLIYVAIPNTGWSEGVVGLFGEALDPDGQYVALEIDADGQPVEGGLVFDLVYDEELGEAGGFRLRVLIDRTRRFGLFPVGVADGQPFAARTAVRENGVVSQVPVGVSLALEPAALFAPLALEFHIVALQSATPSPTATPEAAPAALPVAGWGGCGSCDSCGHPNECVLAPDGQCFWNPGACAAGAQSTWPPSGFVPTAPPLVTNTIAPLPTNTLAPLPTSTATGVH